MVVLSRASGASGWLIGVLACAASALGGTGVIRAGAGQQQTGGLGGGGEVLEGREDATRVRGEAAASSSAASARHAPTCAFPSLPSGS